jgi:hypothetical protein
MTPTKLRKEGERIWGPRWQTPLARFLDVDPRTVRRWVSGETKIKPWLDKLLAGEPREWRS